MRILVIGAYGLLGGYVTTRLLADGHVVVGVGRDTAAAQLRYPGADWVQADVSKLEVAAWKALLGGADAVVNCAGALQDGPRDDLQAVHVRLVETLVQACKAAGTRRFVHISAAGLDRSAGPFAETKLAAERILQSSTLDWVILRPGFILAPAAYGGSALLRGLAALPFVVPAVNARSVVRAVAVDDVVEAVVRSLAVEPAGFDCDLVGPDETHLSDVLMAMRAWLGLTAAPIIDQPRFVGSLAAAAADGLAWLGWRSPMRSATIRQLMVGVWGRSDDAKGKLGFAPRNLSETLARWPAGVQERWFARLYFVKPLALLTLVGFWGGSGIIGFVGRFDAQALLMHSGLTASAAGALVLGCSATDMILAVLTCFRRTATLGLKGMIVVSVAYLAGASLWLPGLWTDALGPLVKVIPAAILALAALAMLNER